MKIAIYGGSFNPIHQGHIKIAKTAIEQLNLDKLFFVPAFKSPFKSQNEYAPCEDRVAMINLVKPEKTEVSMFEIERKKVSYTIDTVSHFKEMYPNDELFLIIGSDNVPKLNLGKNIDDIASMVKIVVFKREGEFSLENIKKYNCHLLDNELFDYASSGFRKGYMKNVDSKVMEYISTRFLYVSEMLENMHETKQKIHARKVGSLAAKIAKIAGIDPLKAGAAGSLMTITASGTNEQQRTFLSNRNSKFDINSNYDLHIISSYYGLKNEYQVQDELILTSILEQRSITKESSLFAKVLFVANQISENQLNSINNVQDLNEFIK